MAEPTVGNATIEPPHLAGDHWKITGQICADSTARAIKICAMHLLYFNAFNNDDDDCTIRIVTNSDDGTEDTAAGYVYVQTSQADDDVYRFEAGAYM